MNVLSWDRLPRAVQAALSNVDRFGPDTSKEHHAAFVSAMSFLVESLMEYLGRLGFAMATNEDQVYARQALLEHSHGAAGRLKSAGWWLRAFYTSASSLTLSQAGLGTFANRHRTKLDSMLKFRNQAAHGVACIERAQLAYSFLSEVINDLPVPPVQDSESASGKSWFVQGNPWLGLAADGVCEFTEVGPNRDSFWQRTFGEEWSRWRDMEAGNISFNPKTAVGMPDVPVICEAPAEPIVCVIGGRMTGKTRIIGNLRDAFCLPAEARILYFRFDGLGPTSRVMPFLFWLLRQLDQGRSGVPSLTDTNAFDMGDLLERCVENGRIDPPILGLDDADKVLEPTNQGWSDFRRVFECLSESWVRPGRPAIIMSAAPRARTGLTARAIKLDPRQENWFVELMSGKPHPVCCDPEVVCNSLALAVAEILLKSQSGLSCRELAAALDVSRTEIRGVLSGPLARWIETRLGTVPAYSIFHGAATCQD